MIDSLLGAAAAGAAVFAAVVFVVFAFVFDAFALFVVLPAGAPQAVKITAAAAKNRRDLI
jgi:hypothetical protein